MSSAANEALLPLKGAQAQASGPSAHVWLSASAGTGKTHVLSARVFRLLLRGAHPESILCLTFTKAGASEMADRIHARLAAWVQMSDEDLALDLRALGEDFAPPMLDRARKLFARVLEATGGGLRIQTIHAFCQQVLAAFPAEAGLIPGFRALEEREQAQLQRETLAELVLRAEETGDAPLLDALRAMALRLGEAETLKYLNICGSADGAFDHVVGDLRDWLFEALALPPGDVEDVIALACSDDAFDMAGLALIAQANAEWAAKRGLEYCDIIARWRGADDAGRAAMLQELSAVFLTAAGEPRKAQAGQVKALPEYAELASRLGERCAQLLALRRRAAYGAFAAQALLAGRAFARAYARAKRAHGAVDFDDLIAHLASLLEQPGIAPWILYKLDQRIDHILIDEAQDTNERQWRIVEALTDEFFAGEGAKGGQLRTLFTVGDFKQAIYGFQGTSPQAFAQARGAFADKAQMAEQDFLPLSLDLSFRSTPAVLDVVDATIGHLGAAALGLSDGDVRHLSNRPFPGEVALWRPVAAGDEAEGDVAGDEDWLTDEDRVLAEQMAARIARWLATGEMLHSQGRPMRAGDIMILVRKRTEFVRLLIARLYEAQVPVAGIDRIRLQSPLAVMDLMAALRFAAQPEDDLNLASLLVSPLIGWTHEQLEAQAAPRRAGLWRHLRTKADAPDLGLLYALLARADFGTPYEMLEWILSGPMQGRAKLMRRMGGEVRDPIDELCQAALHFEQQDRPSLQMFLDWFDRDQGEIKREAEGKADAVRVMTVHGAKGLQAPVVILADATIDPARSGKDSAIALPVSTDAAVPLPHPRKGEEPEPLLARIAEKKRLDMQEHWRLLYVAMTRAEERLYITGTLGAKDKGEVPQDSWFAGVDRAMETLGCAWRDDADGRGVRDWRGREELPPRQAKAMDGGEAETAVTVLPGWTERPAPVESRPPRPLAPTRAVEDDTPQPPPGEAMRQAAERGRMLHALFERMPDVPPDRRRGAADSWLEKSCGLGDAGDRRALIDHALVILDDPAFADIFGPDSLAEAPIAAVVGEQVIAGTVDRLLVSPDHVRVVDFKTGTRVPACLDAIASGHVAQMAAYVAALEVIFPGRTVDAALLYTAGPTIFALPASLMARHKPGLSPGQE